MGLERIPFSHCEVSKAISSHNPSLPAINPLLPPIVDGPRVWVYQRRLPEGVEAIFKAVQEGNEYEFNRNSIQVQIITNNVTLLNQLFSMKEIEQMEQGNPFYLFVKNIYKPWLRDEAKVEQLNKLFKVAKWIVADGQRMCEESDRCLKESDEWLARTEASEWQFEAHRKEIKALNAQNVALYHRAMAELEAGRAATQALIDQHESLGEKITEGPSHPLTTLLKVNRANFLQMATTALLVVFFFVALRQQLDTN